MFRLVVLSAALAVASANPNGVWGAGLALATPLAPSIYSPYLTPVGPVAPIGTPNYRGPLSLAAGQPANILAADGRPLDTLSVNLDRAVHYTARAIEGSRRLQKRSLVDANVAATNFAAAANLGGARWAGPLAAGPLAAGPLAAGPLTATPLAVTPLTLGRSWVGSAQFAVPAFAPVAPLAFGAGARVGGVGNIW